MESKNVMSKENKLSKKTPVSDTSKPDNKSRFTWQPGDIQFVDDDTNAADNADKADDDDEGS